MKHQHYVRNFGLLGIATVGLAVSVPQIADTKGASQELGFVTSSELLSYLAAHLRTAPTPIMDVAELSPSDPQRTASPAGDSVAAAAIQKGNENDFGYYSLTALNVRAGPDKTATKLFILPPRASVRIDRTSGNWARIITSDGNSGWIYASYLTEANGGEKPPSTPSVVVAAPLTVEVVGDEQRVSRIDADHLAASTKHRPDAKRPNKKGGAFVLANDIVMRASPSSRSSKLSVIEGGSKLRVDEWEGSWARVVLPDGRSGWINAL